MNIQKLALNPTSLFKESFALDEIPMTLDWETRLLNLIEDCSKIEFNSGTELLTLLEVKSDCYFTSNNDHSVVPFLGYNKKGSELLGAVLMSLIWAKSKKIFPRIFFCSESYFFVAPDGEIIQINSNKKHLLSCSQKFDLFNSEKSVQLQFPELIKHYFEEVCATYIQEKKYLSLKKAQSYMIDFDPREVKWYARRGLLLKRLGNFSEALSDLKRFTSFCTYEEAPESVKQALIELEGLKATDNFSAYSVH